MTQRQTAGVDAFLAWLAGLAERGAAQLKTAGSSGANDVILDAFAARRFALGTKDGDPVLAYPETDAEAIDAVRWSSAAFVFGRDGRDLVALSSKDARVSDSASMNPVPVRLFIPVASGRLSVWKALKPERLVLARYVGNEKGAPTLADTPSKSIPLAIKG